MSTHAYNIKSCLLTLVKKIHHELRADFNKLSGAKHTVIKYLIIRSHKLFVL